MPPKECNVRLAKRTGRDSVVVRGLGTQICLSEWHSHCLRCSIINDPGPAKPTAERWNVQKVRIIGALAGINAILRALLQSSLGCSLEVSFQ